MKTIFSRILTGPILLGLIFGSIFVAPIQSQAVTLSQPPVDVSTLFETDEIASDRSWSHEGFSVKRFTSPETGRFENLRNTDVWKNEGVYLFAKVKSVGDARLMVYHKESGKITDTGYDLPWHMNLGIRYDRSRPVIRAYNDTIIVKKENVIYTVNIHNFENATEWIDLSKVDITTNLDRYQPSFVRGMLIYSQPNPYGSDFVGYWVKAPNQLERIYEHPGAIGIVKKHTESEKFSFFTTSDEFSNGALLGQIDSGIYVDYKGRLTKIGYMEERSGVFGTVDFGSATPSRIGTDQAVWVGVNGDLYVATLKYSMFRDDGLIDVPKGVPFRTQSDPAVLYNERGLSLSFRRFETAEKYILEFNDPEFKQVWVIPDDARGLERVKLFARTY